MSRESKSNNVHTKQSPRLKSTSRKSDRILKSALNYNENREGGDEMSHSTGQESNIHITTGSSADVNSHSAHTVQSSANSTNVIHLEETNDSHSEHHSPKLSVRRRISFDKNSCSSDSKQLEENDEEPEIPRRKKLRSEVTEDELWEGFPQNIRFKRLTPQKSQSARSSMTSEAGLQERNSEEKSDNSQQKCELNNVLNDTVQTRTVENIFTDFSKVVNEKGSTPVKRTKRNIEKTLMTPKRSARLLEKKESPSIYKDPDFVYTPLKREDSKNSLPESKAAEMPTDLITKGLNNNSDDRGENKSFENEKLKMLYRDVVVKFQTPPRNDKTQFIKEIITDILEDIDNANSCDNVTKWRERPDKEGITKSSTSVGETESSLSIENTCIEEQPSLSEQSGIEFEFKNLNIKSESDSQTVDADSRNSETPNKPGIKIRIKKTKNGAAVIQSGGKSDHAYVQSATKNRTHRKNVNSSGSKGSLPKRRRYIPSVDDEDTLIKRRSPRVANASSVGKGPGISGAKTSYTTEDSDSNESSVYQNTRNGRSEKTNKKKSYSEEDQLLQNSRIEKFACMLWSSEQRRHYQQLNSDLSSQELDNLMRKAWANLEAKDKLRYFSRASNATRDENKHSLSVRQFLDLEFPNDEEDRPPCPAMEKFLSLSSTEQDAELKRWLKFFYEVSPNEYKKLKTLEKPKLKKGEMKSEEGLDPVQYYRRVLYQSILDSKDKISKLYETKKRKQQEIVKEAFGAIVKRLINGKSTEDLKFSRDVVSKQLAEVLLDLQYLENERKVGVSGAPLATTSFENVLNDLTGDTKEVVDSIKSEFPDFDKSCDLGEDDVKENMFSQEILEQVDESELPQLEVESLSEVLDTSTKSNDSEEMVFSKEIFEQLSSIFEQQAKKELIIDESKSENSEVRNPANILTSWVLADQFKAMSRGHYPQNLYSMYSLVDRKHLLPFLPHSDILRTSDSSNEGRPDDVNNSSALKINYEQYQSMMNGLRYPTSTGPISTHPAPVMRVVTTTSGPILQVPEVRPGVRLLTPHRLVRRVPIGHTLVKFTSEQEGRCRVFSVRQAR